MMEGQDNGALTGGRAGDGTLIARVSSIVDRISEIHHMACDELCGPGESSRIHHMACDELSGPGGSSRIHHKTCDELSGPGESSRIHHMACDEFLHYLINSWVYNFTKEHGANLNEFVTQSWVGSIWCSLGSELNVDIVSVAGPTGRR